MAYGIASWDAMGNPQMHVEGRLAKFVSLTTISHGTGSVVYTIAGATADGTTFALLHYQVPSAEYVPGDTNSFDDRYQYVSAIGAGTVTVWWPSNWSPNAGVTIKIIVYAY